MRKRYGLVFVLLSIALGAATALCADVPPKLEATESVYTFCVFGDNRPDIADGAQPTAFREVLKGISALNPAFVVNTGDCIYGSSDLSKVERQYKDYTSTVASFLKQKVYLALGNHETFGAKANQAFFEKELGGLYYSFDYGDSHFIVLDTDLIGQTSRITGEQLDWLRQDLQKSRAARHRFVFFHRPMYPVDGHRGDSLDRYPKDRDALHSLFVRSHVRAVFMGHEHLLNVQKRNGVLYVITGGGGAFTYPSTEGEGDFHHFLVVSVDGDKVEMKVIKPAEGGNREEVLPLSSFLKQ